MGRGQGQGQLLFKLNKLTLREDFKNKRVETSPK